ncbi:unnamed protein product, partial [marine sediment metagenome]
MGFRNGRKVKITVSDTDTLIQSGAIPIGDPGGILVEA